VPAESFASLDVCIVGAEKTPPDLFDAFEEKFGVRPVEGYGATELAPLVSVNIPPSRSSAQYQRDRNEGSVGRPMPGVSAKILSTDDDHECDAGEDGMLYVSGPNVMKGYMGQQELTQSVIQEGWYKTGDIAHVDDEGFLHITGRISRFSKIGGEMVPHIAIEEELNRIADAHDSGETSDDDANDDTVRLCVTSVPDKKKGERLIVLHTENVPDSETLITGLRDAGLSNLFIPASNGFVQVDKVPVLGTGKLDLKGAKQMAAELVNAPAE
ncbi:MAG: AMP-binding protein, partial [Planctomycetota bacterium]